MLWAVPLRSIIAWTTAMIPLLRGECCLSETAGFLRTPVMFLKALFCPFNLPLVNKAPHMQHNVQLSAFFLSQKKQLKTIFHRYPKKTHIHILSLSRSVRPCSTVQTCVGGYCCLMELIWICGCCLCLWIYSPNNNRGICLHLSQNDFEQSYWQATVFILFHSR